MKKGYFLFLLVFIPILLFSQNNSYSKMSPYTRHFINTSKEADSNPAKKQKFRKNFALKSTENGEYIKALIQLNEGADINNIKSLDIDIVQISSSIFTANIPVDKLEAVASLPDVKRLEIATPVRKKMDKARVATNVDKMQAGTNLTQPYKGKNVIVGIIDAGFEYGHINFYDADQNTLRVKKVWDQNTTTGTRPSGFSYGSEYATEAKILAAKYDKYTTETHGTHVAGIAAGADESDSYQGVASESDIVLVSMSSTDNTTNNVSLLDGIKYIYDYATSVSKPAVVNMSLGSHMGPHDGNSLFDIACDELQGPGRLLVGAAGNEGNMKIHISKDFTSSKDTLKSFINFSNYSECPIDIWGDVNKSYKIQLVVYSTTTSAYTFKSDLIDPLTDTNTAGYKYSLNSTTHGADGSINIYPEFNTTNNKANAYIEVDLNSIKYGYKVGVLIIADEGMVHAWAHDYYGEFTNNGIAGWALGNSNYTVGEIGGSGKNIISVGAFNTKNTFTDVNGSNVSYNYTFPVSGISYFSSVGPTVDGRMKPDIAAPGAIIISSYSSRNGVISDEYYKTLLVKKKAINSKTYYYGAMMGTSMASPFVTGVLATWLEANAQLSPDDIRTVLKKTAINDTYTGNIKETGSNIWGYGKIDAWNGVKECIAMSGIDDIESEVKTAILYPNPNKGEFKILFSHSDSDINLSVFSLNGQKVYTENLGQVSPAQEVSVSLTSLPKGVYIVFVKGAYQKESFRLVIE